MMAEKPDELPNAVNDVGSNFELASLNKSFTDQILDHFSVTMYYGLFDKYCIACSG